MIARGAAAALALFLLCAAPGPVRGEEARQTLAIGYLLRSDDPFYQPRRAYTGLRLLDRHPALDGARLGMRDSRIIGRAAGFSFELIERTLAPDEDAVTATRELFAAARVLILDLPVEEMLAVADAFAGEDAILFNPRHDQPALRGKACRPALFHTIPSLDMRTDALAQFAKRRGWEEVLILEGPLPEDQATSAAFQSSARKFGVEAAERRSFLPGNDPRLRDQSNVALLTGKADYDLVFIADGEGDFSRYVPYQTYDPRPVIGGEGLIASGWHWTWERHGAPQLNQRFEKLADRRMQEPDWAGWAAVKAAVEAAVRTRSVEPTALREAMLSPDFQFDGYKGTPVSFRPWSRQLRQPMLLHTHNAVIARAPLEGFLHETSTLDTLGADRAETACATP